jgi:hypothetical protein
VLSFRKIALRQRPPHPAGSPRTRPNRSIHRPGLSQFKPGTSSRRSRPHARGGRLAHRVPRRPRRPGDVEVGHAKSDRVSERDQFAQDAPRRQMSRLFEARRADDGQPWSPHKRNLSGFDLIFSPHESVILAAELPATSAETRERHHPEPGRSGRRSGDPLYRGFSTGRGEVTAARTGRTRQRSVGSASAVARRAPTLPPEDGLGGQTYLSDAPVGDDPHRTSITPS